MSLKVPVALVTHEPDAGGSEWVVGTPRKPRPTAHSAQLSPAPTAAAQHLAPLSPGQLAGPQLSLPPSQAEHTHSWRPLGSGVQLALTSPLQSASDSLGPWQGARMEKRLSSVLFTAIEGRLLIPLAHICFKELLPLSIGSNLEAGESSLRPLDRH